MSSGKSKVCFPLLVCLLLTNRLPLLSVRYSPLLPSLPCLFVTDHSSPPSPVCSLLLNHPSPSPCCLFVAHHLPLLPPASPHALYPPPNRVHPVQHFRVESLPPRTQRLRIPRQTSQFTHFGVYRDAARDARSLPLWRWRQIAGVLSRSVVQCPRIRLARRFERNSFPIFAQSI